MRVLHPTAGVLVPPVEVADHVVRLSVHTPFPVGPTNVYVFRGDRLGLLDTGPGLRRSWEELVDGLRLLGARPEDVEVVLVSHGHVDHHGLAARFPNAEVLVGRQDLEGIVDVMGHLREHVRVLQGIFPAWGVPPVAAEQIGEFLLDLGGIAESVPHARAVVGGTLLEGWGRPFEVLEMPGHSEGLICLYRAADGVLLSSDHLLLEITPNPGFYTSGGVPRTGLTDYTESLRKVLTLDVVEVFPGHGQSFGDPTERIHQLLAHHEDRLEVVRGLLGADSTVWQVSHRLFGDRDAGNSFLALRESFGHLDVLCGRGLAVVEDGDDGATRVYRAA
jgi:glyoxylase-like metal-dependent hydrolase (beta-lactamase superfamily II)